MPAKSRRETGHLKPPRRRRVHGLHAGDELTNNFKLQSVDRCKRLEAGRSNPPGADAWLLVFIHVLLEAGTSILAPYLVSGEDHVVLSADFFT